MLSGCVFVVALLGLEPRFTSSIAFRADEHVESVDPLLEMWLWVKTISPFELVFPWRGRQP